MPPSTPCAARMRERLQPLPGGCRSQPADIGIERFREIDVEIIGIERDAGRIVIENARTQPPFEPAHPHQCLAEIGIGLLLVELRP